MTLFSHLSEPDIALHSGGDLEGLPALAAKLHLAGCPYCRLRLERYSQSRAALAEAALEMPAGLDWDSLSAEISANIHLGLAAGDVVRRDARPPRAAGLEPASPFRWQFGAVLASLTLVVASVWLMDAPRESVEPAPERAVLALPAGAEIRTIDFDGAERARQLDNETGQMTITQVYAD